MDGTRLTGLWKNTNKEGQTYLSGSLGSARMLVLPNKFKREEKDPDYTVMIVTPEKKEPRTLPVFPVEGGGL